MRLSSRLLLVLLATASAAAPVYATTTVKLQTSIGDITFALDEDSKPVTVANFLKYIRDGRYTDSFANRLPQGFVLQGGGQTYSSANSFGTVATYDPIVNEYSVGTTYSNVEGTIAMAKVDGNPNSATSQWFINLGDNSTTLDNQNGGFTVFGHVVSGSAVVTRLHNFTNYNNADGTDLILHNIYTAPYDDLPVLSVVDDQFSYLNDFIYTTWTIIGGTKPVITSPATVYSLEDSPFTYQIAATDSPTTFAVTTGTLPGGLLLNTSTGLISGTPTDSTPATLVLTIAATNGDGTGSASLQIGYNYPVIADSLTANATQGQPFRFQVQATNNPTSYSANGLPDGVTIDTTTGLITGVPTVSGAGTVTLYAGNAGGTYSAALHLTIAEAPTAPPSVTTKNKFTGKNGKVILKGSASEGTVKVEVKTGKGGFKTAKGSPTNWEFRVKGMKPGKYKFKVRATNAAGQSSISTVKAVIKG